MNSRSVTMQLQTGIDVLCIRVLNARRWCAVSCCAVPCPPTPPETPPTPKDFVFCKEVRLGTYSANAHHLPLAAIVAAKAMAADPRAEARHGQRVPYVVRGTNNKGH